MIYGLVFVMAMLVTVATVQTGTVVSHRSMGHVQRDVTSRWMQAYSNAAMAFAQANPGYSGQVTDAQIAPYLGAWQTAAASMTAAGLQHGAEIAGGQLVIWCAGSSASGAAQPGPDLTSPASGYSHGGNLVNPILGNQGPLPTNIPAGATVMRVQA